jgi:hypothetical protein
VRAERESAVVRCIVSEQSTKGHQSSLPSQSLCDFTSFVRDRAIEVDAFGYRSRLGGGLTVRGDSLKG